MKQTKATKNSEVAQEVETPAKESITLVAIDEIGTVIRYHGQTFRIRPGMAPQEFMLADLPYDSKIHIDQAIKAGHIAEAKGE